MILTTEQLSDLLGITSRRVNQLGDDGTFKKSGRNQWNGPECVAAFVKYREDLIRNEYSTEGSVESEIEKQKLEKLKLDVAKAQRQDAIERGTMDTKENIEQAVDRLLTDLRAWNEDFVSKVLIKATGLRPSDAEKIQRDLADFYNQCADWK